MSLCSDIFIQLDQLSTNLISPETYSSFLETQGEDLRFNVWKSSMQSGSKDNADFELRRYYDNFSIEYILQDRLDESENEIDSVAQNLENLLKPADSKSEKTDLKSLSGGKMPMLTRKGFVDVVAVEVLYDPSRGWENLNRVLRSYGLWQERAPPGAPAGVVIPREVIPETSPPELQERVQKLVELSQEQGQDVLSAKLAQNQLPPQGQEAALG
jgi:hypothetical protein